MAWLHATPKPDPRSRRAKIQTEAPKLSRLDQLKRQKITPAMPPNPAPLIIDRLVEIGLVGNIGMGSFPLPWGEISDWCDRTGTDLPAWEARLIRRLSADYIAEGKRAEAETCPPPWRGEVTQAERDSEVSILDAVLG